MLRWLTLEGIKQQLRIEQDFHEEDEWLEGAGEAAEYAILGVLNRSYENLYEVYGHIPAPVRQASLMLVASLYKDREKDLVQEVHNNKTFALMLKPCIRLASPSTNEQNQNQYGCKNL